MEEIFEKVAALTSRGMDFGTARTRKILNALSSPDNKLKILHIAGTNGKGSTAEFLTNILIAAGKRVGTFTSPQVYSYFDQFRIDGRPAEKSELAASFKKAYGAGCALGATEFEVETAGALSAFADVGCEYAVIECGLGGRYDATNAINKKQVAIITSISLEHTSVLGDTLEKICEQKSGIIKDCAAVVNAHQPPEVEKYFKAIGAYFADAVTYCGGNEFLYLNKKFRLNARGSLQIFNAATAIEAARICGMDEGAIYAGIEKTVPQGRLEILYACGKTYILDGGHNPAALVPLGKLLGDYVAKEVTLIFGCLSDKDINGNLKTIAGCAEAIIAVGCPSPRASGLDETEDACRKYFTKVQRAESVAAALSMAFTKTVVVCGSFTLLPQAKAWIKNQN